MASDARFLAGLPKAELHVHLEGTLEPAMMFELARRNGIGLGWSSVEELQRAYHFTRLQDFLDLYYEGCGVLQTARDFYDLTWAYLAQLHRQGVVYAELSFDPQAHTGRGIPFSEVIDGVHGAVQEGARQLGVRAQLILCFLRHLDEASAQRTLDDASPYLDRILGVGLDSSELGNPPSGFEAVFRRARDAGLPATAHAGEEGPPEYVWEALDVLGARRIDHGNRALEDPDLVDRLVSQQVPLTLCPLSNLRLCVVDELRNHPLPRMLELGLLVTVNSDDPSYFGGHLEDNFAAIQDALSLTREHLVVLARNSFRAAFLDPDESAAYLARIDAYADVDGR